MFKPRQSKHSAARKGARQGAEGASKGQAIDFPQNVAEEVGFEPTEGVNPRRFSRPVHSTTLPLLRRPLPNWPSAWFQAKNLRKNSQSTLLRLSMQGTAGYTPPKRSGI